MCWTISLSLEKARFMDYWAKRADDYLALSDERFAHPKHGKVIYHDVDVRRRLPITLQDMFLVPERV